MVYSGQSLPFGMRDHSVRNALTNAYVNRKPWAIVTTPPGSGCSSGHQEPLVNTGIIGSGIGGKDRRAREHGDGE